MGKYHKQISHTPKTIIISSVVLLISAWVCIGLFGEDLEDLYDNWKFHRKLAEVKENLVGQTYRLNRITFEYDSYKEKDEIFTGDNFSAFLRFLSPTHGEVQFLDQDPIPFSYSVDNDGEISIQGVPTEIYPLLPSIIYYKYWGKSDEGCIIGYHHFGPSSKVGRPYYSFRIDADAFWDKLCCNPQFINNYWVLVEKKNEHEEKEFYLCENSIDGRYPVMQVFESQRIKGADGKLIPGDTAFNRDFRDMSKDYSEAFFWLSQDKQYLVLALKPTTPVYYYVKLTSPFKPHKPKGWNLASCSAVDRRGKQFDRDVSFRATLLAYEGQAIYKISQGSTQYMFRIADSPRHVTQVGNFSKGGFKARDLGISVHWADRNLGAHSPSSRGDYYAWGELETKSSFSHSTYQFMSRGRVTKYHTEAPEADSDNDVELLLKDDAAHEKLGALWHIPSVTEVLELMKYCDLRDTVINYVDYVIFKSKINGNSILFPQSTGLRNGNEWVDYIDEDEGNGGYYWTSTLAHLGEDDEYASCFLVKDSGERKIVEWERDLGMTIRPVYGASTSFHNRLQRTYPKKESSETKSASRYVFASPGYFGNIYDVGYSSSWDTTLETPSSSSVSHNNYLKSHDCRLCYGTGHCHLCNGSKYTLNYWDESQRQECTACGGSGKCSMCRGRGKI